MKKRGGAICEEDDKRRRRINTRESRGGAIGGGREGHNYEKKVREGYREIGDTETKWNRLRR